MRRVMILTLTILVIWVTPGWADYTIEHVSVPSIEEYEFVETNTTNVNEKTIRKALNEVDYEFEDDFVVYITTSYVKNKGICGIASSDNKIVLLKFVPRYEIDEKLNLNKYYQNVVTHELGHLVYYSLTDKKRVEYFELRKLPQEWGDSYRTSYVNRPSEIFAEDFRILFGNNIANKKSHMNRNIENPTEVEGLREFMRNIKKEG